MPEARNTNQSRVCSFAVLAFSLPSLALAGGPSDTVGPLMESHAPAGLAFDRYIAGLAAARPWGLETVDIDASLPKLEKHGRLRAIRRLLPAGKPEFQVVEMDGDRTVRQQVIARYLTAEVKAADIPSASVAVTPENYKFRYQGRIESGALRAYIFHITPRHKREGLIDGELWIDSETGVAIRQSGRLVKQPSVFVKRVDVTRETYLRDGTAEMRVTRLIVDTRLVGRGELTIQERPCAAAEGCASEPIPTASLNDDER